LRRPSASEFLKYDETQPGISEILGGKVLIKNRKNLISLIRHDEDTGIHFLTSGKQAPNPAELFDSPTFKKLIMMLRKEFDFILIDSPPLLPVTDGGLIAKQSDGVLLIIKAGSTKVDQFRGGRDLLTKVGVPILGAVLNMIPLNRNGEAYGYRYGYSYGYQRKYGVYGAGDYGVELVKGEEDRPYAPKMKVRDVVAERESKRKQIRVYRFKQKLAHAQMEPDKLHSDKQVSGEYPPIHIFHSHLEPISESVKKDEIAGLRRFGGDLKSENLEAEPKIVIPQGSRLAKALAEDCEK
jgi:capsular exopolysaccharide synthesis family protein